MNKQDYLKAYLWETELTRGRTYIMITYVSKENNLGPGDTIMSIWGLKGPIFIL